VTCVQKYASAKLRHIQNPARNYTFLAKAQFFKTMSPGCHIYKCPKSARFAKQHLTQNAVFLHSFLEVHLCKNLNQRARARVRACGCERSARARACNNRFKRDDVDESLLCWLMNTHATRPR